MAERKQMEHLTDHIWKLACEKKESFCKAAPSMKQFVAPQEELNHL